MKRKKKSLGQNNDERNTDSKIGEKEKRERGREGTNH